METNMQKTKTWSRPRIITEIKVKETLGSQVQLGADSMQAKKASS